MSSPPSPTPKRATARPTGSPAFATSPDTDEATALLAARALTDQRRLAVIAKSEARDSVRADALSRLTDERSLGSIARHAKNEAAARAALDRLTSHEALVEVAAARRAPRRRAGGVRARDGGAQDLALLKSVESHAQQKAVSKRARALIQEIEEAEAARRAADEERRRQQAAVLDAIDRLADVTDVATANAELARLSDEWQTLANDDAGGRGSLQPRHGARARCHRAPRA